jgi:hypothetical protein
MGHGRNNLANTQFTTSEYIDPLAKPRVEERDGTLTEATFIAGTDIFSSYQISGDSLRLT